MKQVNIYVRLISINIFDGSSNNHFSEQLTFCAVTVHMMNWSYLFQKKTKKKTKKSFEKNKKKKSTIQYVQKKTFERECTKRV